MMSGRNRRIRKKEIISAGAVCLSVILLSGGCEEQETAKTIVIPEVTEETTKGIELKNIQEFTYEGEFTDITWTEDTAGNLCVIKDEKNRGILGIFQRIDIYQKAVSEEVVFEESMIGYVKIAPGGKYIAYEHPVDENRELILYEVETGEKEAVMVWNIGSSIYRMEWCGDGTKLFVWTDMEGLGEDQNAEEDRLVYCFDMEREEKEVSQIRLPITGRMCGGMFPNEDGTRVFIEEKYYGEDAGWGEEEMESNEMEAMAVNGEEEVKGRYWLLNVETGEVQEVDFTHMNIKKPVKYTNLGLFGTNGDKLWLAREPLGQVSEKRLLEEAYEDICICDKGDHIFLIEKEEGTDYFQVTGIFLEDGEIQEYQVLYKEIYGDFEQPYINAFIGMDDHELVLCSVEYGEYNEDSEYGEEEQWRMNVKVLEY